MLNNCYYQFIEHLIPKYEKNEITLQLLCATNLTKSRDIFEKYVERFPPNLFPYLLQTIIRYNYSKFCSEKVTWLLSDTIGPIVQMWPHPVLVLRDHLHVCATVEQSKFHSLHRAKSIYLKFLHQVVREMIQSPVFGRNYIHHKNTGRRLHRLDVSRLGINVEEFIIQYYLGESKSKPEDSTSSPIEFVCDLSLSNHAHSWAILPHLVSTSKIGNMIMKVDKVTIESLGAQEFSRIILFMNKNNDLNYLHITLCAVSIDFFEEDLPSSIRSLQGLDMSYCHLPRNPDFKFLPKCTSLHQLDVSGIILEEGWSVLQKLPNGLSYLRMVGCSLKPTDLLGLVGKHSDSLMQVDFSEVRMNSPPMFDALSHLMFNMKKVEVLELEACSLDVVPWDTFEPFLRTLSNCSKLKVLQLFRNRFTPSFLLNKLISIAQSKSLQLICISSPDVFQESDFYLLCSSQSGEIALEPAFKARIEAQHSCLQVDWSK